MSSSSPAATRKTTTLEAHLVGDDVPEAITGKDEQLVAGRYAQFGDVRLRNNKLFERPVAKRARHREDARNPPRSGPDDGAAARFDALVLAVAARLVVLGERLRCS